MKFVVKRLFSRPIFQRNRLPWRKQHIGLFIFTLLMIKMSHAQIVLQFQPHVNTRARTLGDILRIDPDDTHWAQVSLGSHPASGAVITKKQILQWMIRHFGSFNSEWRGKTHIQVNDNAHKIHIKKGDPVHIRANDHGITIMMDAIALADAHTGQMIEVQNPRSQQNFWVKITDTGQGEAII